MTTKEVADRFYELTKQNDWGKIQDELYAENARSVEPASGESQGMKSVEGMDAIKKKGEEFNQMVEEVHGGFCSEPVVGGNCFSVAMGMDITMKGMGRMEMDEIAVYQVKDGKIVLEQFFY